MTIRTARCMLGHPFPPTHRRRPGHGSRHPPTGATLARATRIRCPTMLVGTETEYGISAPGRPDADPHVLSRAAVVDSCAVPATVAVADTHNRVLGNGARLYVDHGHPEYSGPECTSAADALTWELAGDEIVRTAAVAASVALGTRVAVFRNNTDGKGHSYGYHENHLLARSTPFERVVELLPLSWSPESCSAVRDGWGPVPRTRNPGSSSWRSAPTTSSN